MLISTINEYEMSFKVDLNFNNNNNKIVYSFEDIHVSLFFHYCVRLKSSKETGLECKEFNSCSPWGSLYP